MLDVERIYAEYIESKQEKRNKKYAKYEGLLGASSTGYCHKKQYYKLTDSEAEKASERVSRLLRLGTVVHSEIEKAIKAWNKSHDTKIYTEHQVKIPELRVVGHIDILELYPYVSRIYDFKTVASFKWRKKFGRFKNRDPNTDTTYKLQLGSYGLGVGKKPENTELYLVWYNKDDSSMKPPVKVDSVWMKFAKEYWIELWKNIDSWMVGGVNPDDIKVDGKHSPMDTSVYTGVKQAKMWECNYCQYSERCNSPHYTKKRKSRQLKIT